MISLQIMVNLPNTTLNVLLKVTGKLFSKNPGTGIINPSGVCDAF